MAGINQKIKAVDYNAIQSDIAAVLGTGSGQTGYGQTVLSSQVTTSDVVTVNEYAALRYDIINAYQHQENSLPSNVDAQTLGKSIRYNSGDEPIDYWQTVATQIVTNKNRLAVFGQRVTVNHGTASQVWPGSLGTEWTDTLYATVTVTFTSSENARFFFNAGGTIDFSSSRTGGSSTQQNASWTSLLSTAGTRQFGGNTPGTGVNPNDGTNYFRLSNTLQTWSSVTASSPYALNTWRIQASTNDVPAVSDNSSGTSRRITFYVTWEDDHEGLGGPPDQSSGTPIGAGTYGPDAVDGEIQLTVITTEPSGVMEPSPGSGNFEVESPLVTISAIQQA